MIWLAGGGISAFAAGNRIAIPKGVWAKPIRMAGTLWVPTLGVQREGLTPIYYFPFLKTQNSRLETIFDF